MRFQIVEEVPRLIYGSCENLRKIPKVYKRKGIQNCSPNFEFKYFQTQQTPKQKWWGLLTCYYKPPLIFWQGLVGENPNALLN